MKYLFNNHHQSNCIVEPYNKLFSTHSLLEHTEVSFVFDYRKGYNLCKDKLGIDLPSYNDMNLLMARIESGFTVSLRFEIELNVDLNELDIIIHFTLKHIMLNHYNLNCHYMWMLCY